jgi:decaprenylphospho-beta-D-ribofuranose 2-oxidase
VAIVPKRDNIIKTLALLILGGIVGMIVALLLAPSSGKETRTQLKQGLVNRIGGSRRSRSLNLKRISNWGNYPKIEAEIYEFEDLETLRSLILRLDNIIPRGNGRCYGDSALAPHIISSLRYNKFLSFDEKVGLIQCQSGVLLADILEVILPKGWFLHVTPGTKWITLGGAIASDVHGKSQHKAGNFSDHVVELELMTGDGSVICCSKEKNTDLFWTTCGGMGLTGVILKATIRLKPVETAYFCQESIKARNLDHLMDLFEESEAWPYSVAWIDCLTTGKNMGRGVLTRGEHATLADLKKPAHRQNPLVPKPPLKLHVLFNFPNFALNKFTIKVFNALIWGKQLPSVVTSVVSYNSFFYPLDSISNWNRIYGSRGFTQYQFILPKSAGRAGLNEILQRIANSGLGSFLAVLKLYGKQNGYLPFAMEGYSLALDFPITEGLFEFLDELDEIVLAYGGRIYLSKDARMNKAMFMQSYPRVERFIENVRIINKDVKFKSLQSDRVGVTQ